MNKPALPRPALLAALSLLLATDRARAEVLINEFMAVNDTTLADEDGDYSDWIELHNAGEEAESIAGWYLTDAADDLTRWAFPAVTLEPGGYLVVFASGKDRTGPLSELHTNFRLDGGGEYLALVRPDGETVATEFSPGYPDQSGDTSFGIVRETEVLVAEGAPGRYLVPTGPLGLDWAGGEPFDDGAWEEGQAALGFDHGQGGYFSHFFTDLKGPMFGRSDSVYLRVPFTVREGMDLELLRLRMRYDDGFVAYINGVPVASSNAPDPPRWDSAATAGHADLAAVLARPFPFGGEALPLRTGENILAVHGLNFQPDDADPDFLLIPELEAVNRLRISLASPTPGAENSTGSLLEKVAFSPARGFFEEPVEVTLSTDIEGAQIRYTTNFTTPGLLSARYTGPIRVDRSTVIRAAAIKPGFLPSPTATHTYVFFPDVVTQPRSPAGWPGGDYQMRPSVVNAHSYEDFVGYLRSLPSLMITTSLPNLFDGSTGIHTHPTSRGRAWERPGSLEWVYGDGTSGFGENCGIRIQGGLGGGGRSYRKKSWRLLFKSDYGPSKLRFPFFAWDEGATRTFDQLILRAGANDRQDYTRDEFARRCQIAMGEPGSHGIHVHVYLNGLYWGMYNAVERPAGDFAASYFGGDKDDYDALAHNAGNVIDGDNRAWNAMVSLGRQGLSGRERYMEYLGRNPDGTPNPAYPHHADVDNCIVYMLANIYLGMGDWPGHNWYAARRRDPGSDGFKFFIWDGEGAFRDSNVTGVNGGAAEAYGDLRGSAEFRLRFADLAQRHLFNGGALTPEAARERFAELSDSIEYGVVTEEARWGHIGVDSWRGRRDSKLNGYLPSRRDTVVGYLRGADLYPTVDAPAFNQHGGEVPGGFLLSMDAPVGVTTYYTLDGSDPREAWTDDALGTPYTGPVAVDYNLRVKARAHSPLNGWSALSETLFVVAGDSPLRVSEVMYHPRAPGGLGVLAGYSAGDYEFIEIVNTGRDTVGLAGLHLAGGVTFDFGAGQVATLDPGEIAVVVRNPAAFATRYPDAGIKVAGAFDGALDNAGESFSLRGPGGDVYWSATFNDARGWPAAADGAGHSLVPAQFSAQPRGVLDYGGNWRASTYIDGSPGAADPAPPADLILNEVVARADPDSLDGIELFNRTGSEVALDDWFLSDDPDDLRKWPLAGGGTVGGNAWVYLDAANGLENTQAGPFALAAPGGRLLVSHLPATGRGRVADAVRLKAQDEGGAVGRYPDGDACFHPLAPTPGTANSAPPTGPIIGEIMYDPLLPGGEYLKICNPGAAPVPLWNEAGPWRVDGADFEFPAGMTIPAGGWLLLVGFDPAADPAALDAFRAAYGLTGGAVPILGPFQGRLDNSGERVALERPRLPGAPGTGSPWVVVEEVIYFNQSPWPTGANGTGRSLLRLNPQVCAAEPFNWILSAEGGGAGESCVIPEQPAIALSPQALEVSTPENVNPPGRTFSIRNVGVGPMDFALAADVGWIEVEPAAGQVGEGEEFQVTVTFKAEALATGEHTGRVTLTSATAVNSPRSFEVGLAVTERDKARPALAGADPMGNPNQITVTFSKPLEPGDGPNGAENVANYQLDNGVFVTGATLDPGGMVLALATSAMTAGTTYTLTVSNVHDRAVIPNPIEPGTAVRFTYTYTAPVADAGGGAVVMAGAGVLLDGSASLDPDGGPQPLTFSWEQIHGPAAALTNAEGDTASATLAGKGTYVFRLTVSDGVASDSDEVIFLVSETVNFFSAGQRWRYYDAGEDLGTAWRAVGYDDASWSSGPAQLGYGDGDEATEVSFGPNSGSKFRTTYFRTTFEAADTAEIGNLTFHLLRDDGAAVYLNGNEVVRSNLPGGTIDFDTTAENVVGGADENTFFPYTVPADDLVEGTNVLAVEIHQISGGSSDISFDLSLDTEVVEIDEDADGLPDSWEVIALGSTTATADADDDGDGLSNLEEFIAGTDPADAASNIAPRLTVEGDEILVRYDTVDIVDDGFPVSPTARYYTLEINTDDSATGWQPVPGHTGRLGDGGTVAYTHPTGEPARFFRLRIWVE